MRKSLSTVKINIHTCIYVYVHISNVNNLQEGRAVETILNSIKSNGLFTIQSVNWSIGLRRCDEIYICICVYVDM